MSDLYTVFIEEVHSVSKDGGAAARPVLITYYDVEWKQVQFYSRKHSAQHITVEQQSRRLDRAPTTRMLDEIRWSEAAKAAPINRETFTPATRSKVVSIKSAAPKLSAGERVKIDAGYADLVNAMIGDG